MKAKTNSQDELERTYTLLSESRKAADRNANLAGECLADLTKLRMIAQDGSRWVSFNVIEDTRKEILAILLREGKK
jgi:hypothetical protein